MIAGSYDILAGKVFRIGHMGENCREEKVYLTLKALDSVFRQKGIELQCELHKEFIQAIY
jgi:aspartate aminotransferase-like enzyme